MNEEVFVEGYEKGYFVKSSVCRHIFRKYGIKKKSQRKEMKIHFTNLFGQSSKSVALMAQNDIMNVVRELGVNELGIYFYDHSNEPASELNSRMDGI